MRIRKRLQINVVISVLTAVVVCFVLSISLFSLNRASNATRFAGDVLAACFERITLRNDFIQTNSARAKEQWYASHGKITRLLRSAPQYFRDVEDRRTIDKLIEANESIGTLFSAIVANRETKSRDPDSAALSREAEARLVSQVNMRVYEVVVNNRKLLASARVARAAALRFAGEGIIFALLALIAAAMINAWAMGRTITARARLLQEGAKLIGGGDLGHGINLKGDDEFAEIAQAFNSMTAELRTSYSDLQREIEERKRAQQEILEHEHELRLVMDTVPALISYIDRDFRYRRVNGNYEGWFGFKREEMEGRHVRDVLGEEAWNIVRPHLQQALEGETVTYEELMPYHQGGPRWIAGTMVPNRDTTGRVIGIVAHVMDITARKKAEEALQALSDCSQAVIRARDEAEYLHSVCRVIVKVCGYSMVWIGFADNDEAKSVRPAACSGFEDGYLETLKLTWDDRERGRGPTGTAIRTGEVAVCRNMLTDPAFSPWREEAIKRGYASSIVFPLMENGRPFGAITIYSAEADPFSENEVNLLAELAGNVSYGIEVLRTRAAQKEAEEARRESRAMLQAALASMTDAVFISDREGRFIEFNDAFATFHRFRSRDECARTLKEYPDILDVYMSDGAPAPLEMWAVPRALRGETVSNAEYRLRRKDTGESWVGSYSFGPILDKDRAIVGSVVVGRDITDMKLAEETLREAHDELAKMVEERTRELHDKELLLKEIHHRVKNNLQVISSLVGLQADNSDDETVREVLMDVTYRVRSMALVHEKLYQSTDLARIDFAEYTRGLLNYLWRAHGSAAAPVRLTLDLSAVALPVDTAVPCGLILNELAGNALKHAFRGRDSGEVAVSLKCIAEGRIRLCVADNGVGLPAGFDWRQAKSLGLRLVSMLAGQIGAKVNVEGNSGTRFEIII